MPSERFLWSVPPGSGTADIALAADIVRKRAVGGKTHLSRLTCMRHSIA